MNSDTSLFGVHDASPSRIAAPGRNTLIRAAALAAAVHLWLLFGISWDMPLRSVGGMQQITVEIAPSLASRAARNARDNSPADAPSTVDNQADAVPPEKSRENTTPQEYAPAAATNTAGERSTARGTQPLNSARPPLTPRNAAAARNDTAGATAERESASGAALNGVYADEKLQTVSNPAPRYPEQARRRGHEGSVHVEADVDERGIPTAVRVQRSSGHAMLDDAAVEAVGKWRFRPARSAGKTVPLRVVVPIEFRLKSY